VRSCHSWAMARIAISTRRTVTRTAPMARPSPCMAATSTLRAHRRPGADQQVHLHAAGGSTSKATTSSSHTCGYRKTGICRSWLCSALYLSWRSVSSTYSSLTSWDILWTDWRTLRLEARGLPSSSSFPSSSCGGATAYLALRDLHSRFPFPSIRTANCLLQHLSMCIVSASTYTSARRRAKSYQHLEKAAPLTLSWSR
jgi:hypothetical protein